MEIVKYKDIADKPEMIDLFDAYYGDESLTSSKKYKFGNRTLTAKQMKKIQLDATKEQCYEMMRRFQSSTVMALVPKQYLKIKDFILKMSEIYDDGIICHYAHESLRNNAEFMIQMIEKYGRNAADALGENLINNPKFLEILLNNKNIEFEGLFADFFTKKYGSIENLAENKNIILECVSKDAELLIDLIAANHEYSTDENVIMYGLLAAFHQCSTSKFMNIVIDKINIKNCTKHKKEISKIQKACIKYSHLEKTAKPSFEKTATLCYYESIIQSYLSQLERARRWEMLTLLQKQNSLHSENS